MKSYRIWFVLIVFAVTGLISCRTPRLQTTTEVVKTVTIPEYNTDTVFVRSNEKDTLYIYKDRVRVRTIVTPDTVWQSVSVPPQTIRDTVKITTEPAKNNAKPHFAGYLPVVILFTIIGIACMINRLK